MQFELKPHVSSHILMEFQPYNPNENVQSYILYVVEKTHLIFLNNDNPMDSIVAYDKSFHLILKFHHHNLPQNRDELKNQTVLYCGQFVDNNSLALFPIRRAPYMLQHVKFVLVSYFPFF